MPRGNGCEKNTVEREEDGNNGFGCGGEWAKSKKSNEGSSSSGAVGGSEGCLYPDNIIMDDGVSFQVRVCFGMIKYSVVYKCISTTFLSV